MQNKIKNITLKKTRGKKEYLVRSFVLEYNIRHLIFFGNNSYLLTF